MRSVEYLLKIEEKLMSEVCQIIGMMAEVRMKAVLLKEKKNEISFRELKSKTNRLQKEFNRYTVKFDELTNKLTGIHNELNQFSGLDHS